MKLFTRAGVIATAGLLAYGPAHTAHATTDDTPQLTCRYQVTDADLAISVESATPIEELLVTVDGQRIDHTGGADPDVILIDRPEDSDTPSRVEVSSGDGEGSTECQVDPADDPEPPPTGDPEPTQTPTPVESPTTETDEPDPTPTEPEMPTETGTSTEDPEPTPPDTETTPDPTPTDTTPTPEPEESPSVTPLPTPNTTSPAQTDPPTATTPVPQSPSPTTPSTPTAHQPEPDPTTSWSQSDRPSESDQPVPRQFRPLAESPRYLLPQLLGTRSAQRGSPLIMPRPRDSDDGATELETLPPISEDEIEAIKAQLSSPGRADTANSQAQPQGTDPDLQGSSNTSWWVVAGTTALIGASGVGWILWRRRKRRH